MALASLQYVRGTLTQGGADAFVEGAVTTGLSVSSPTRAFRLREFVIDFSGNTGGAVQGSTYEVQISRRTKAAISNIADVQLAFLDRWINSFTTSGLALLSQMRRYTWDEEAAPVFVEETIYLNLDSAASALANAMRYRFGFQEIKISQDDRNSLLLSYLNT